MSSFILFQTAINNMIFNVIPEIEEEERKRKEKEKKKKK